MSEAGSVDGRCAERCVDLAQELSVDTAGRPERRRGGRERCLHGLCQTQAHVTPGNDNSFRLQAIQSSSWPSRGRVRPPGDGPAHRVYRTSQTVRSPQCPRALLNWLTAAPSSRRRREASDCRTRRCAPTSRRPRRAWWRRALADDGGATYSYEQETEVFEAERERDEAEAVAEEAEEELRAVRARAELQLGGDLLKRTEELADLRAAKRGWRRSCARPTSVQGARGARLRHRGAARRRQGARRRVGGAARSGAPSGRSCSAT